MLSRIFELALANAMKFGLAWDASIAEGWAIAVVSYCQEWCMNNLTVIDFKRRVSADPADRLAPVHRLLRQRPRATA